MTSEIGILKYKTFNSKFIGSFICLNNLDVQQLRVSQKDSDVVAVEIRYGPNSDQTFYSSLGPTLPQIPVGYAGFGSVISSKLGIKEDDELLISLCQAVPVTVARVRARCNDDYNIMLNVQSALENSVLDQVRIIAHGQNICLKIGNISVDLITESFTPSGKCGRLEKYSEFVVLDDTTEPIAQSTNAISQQEEKRSLTDVLWNILQWGTSSTDKPNAEIGPAPIAGPQPKKANNCIDILKAAAMKKPALDFRVIRDTISYDDAITTTHGFKTNAATHCSITKMHEKAALLGNEKRDDRIIYGLVHTIPKIENAFGREIYLSEDNMKKLDLCVGSRVYVEEADQPKNVEVNETFADKVKIVTETKEAKDTKKSRFNRNTEDFYSWPNLSDLTAKVFKVVQKSFANAQNSNVLIVAPPGCGKTSVIENLQQRFLNRNIYCCLVNCKELRGKKIESLLKIFTSKWSECAYREPSVLFLDDLDSLILQDEHEEAGLSAIYSNKVASVLTDLAESFQNTNHLCLVATVSNLEILLTAMSTTRGPRLFDLVVDIPELTADDRKDILKHFELEVNDDVMNKTQGYRIQDLLDLSARARLNALISESSQATLEDVEKALEDTTPMGLLGVRLHKDVPYTWEDVGGMKEVKTVLDEIFRWPSQFPQVFEACPLRLQSGALLYGPPGCGKTLVAGAVANECQMNFISVKGPELLSKYVGASEAAVRDLFDRAARAQPCLLFFDELDSLAPRRGHDTTGVTDRVVNQLLTQLDGVESRTGVWVLGASSRPDLIDPALLRPGRLDRAISCHLPSVEDRQNILEVLSRNLTLADDIQFNILATKTENYSGADLQALLYNSHMKAVQSQTDDSGEDVIITLENVDNALEETKPSLSQSDRLKYDKLFQRFMNTKGPPETPMPQKVTFM